jgi:ribulose 1,5-bisphosphate synthetase/thiazole synthase
MEVLETDALVVGAEPAGLAASALLAPGRVSGFFPSGRTARIGGMMIGCRRKRWPLPP